MDRARDVIAAECTAWLQTFLLPRVLAVAEISAKTASEVLTDLRREPRIARVEDGSVRLSAFEVDAVRACGELRVVSTAVMASHLSGDAPAARDHRDAVLLLVYRDVFEYVTARGLAGYAEAALYPHGSDLEFDRRELRAEDAYTRWRTLGGPVGEAFLDLMDGCAIETEALSGGFG